MILPEYEIQPDEKVYTLKIYMGKRSQALSFVENEVRKSVENPEQFMKECKSFIIAALRRLKRLERKPAG